MSSLSGLKTVLDLVDRCATLPAPLAVPAPSPFRPSHAVALNLTDANLAVQHE